MIVIIPSLHFNHLDNFFRNYKSVDLSSVEKIIIFNNSNKVYQSSFAKIKIINLRRNIGVNQCWNHGLILANYLEEDLLLLNDDVLFKHNFFTMIYEALKENKKSVICPNALSLEDFEKGVIPQGKRYARMRKRNGWAFAIPKSLIEDIFLIPRKMNIFFGDDWIWGLTKGRWIKDNHNLIFHYIGKTLKKNMDLRAIYSEDKKHFLEAIKEFNN